jgi:hypothetical protein
MLYRWALYNPAQNSPVKVLPDQNVTQWNEAHANGFNAYMREFRMDSQIPEFVKFVVERVRELQQHGTRVVFYFPADIRIKQLSPHKEFQSALEKELPDVQMVDPPDNEFPIYRPDGMHLHAASGVQFFDYLMHAAGLTSTSNCKVVAASKL